MSGTIRTRYLRTAMIIAMILMTSALFAQPAQRTQRLSDDELLRQYDPVRIDDFRNDFRQVLTTDREVFVMMGNIDAAKYVADREVLVGRLSDAEVARMLAAGVDLQPLLTATERLRATVEHGRIADMEQQSVTGTNSDGLPGAPYSGCGSTRANSEGMLAGKVVLDVAKGVWSAASRACDEVVVILGEGGNTSLVCIIVDVVLFAAETVYDGFEFCDADIDSAEINGSYQRLEHVHSDLVNAETHIVNNDNTNRQTIVTNDNSNTSTIVTNDNTNKNTIVTNDNTNTAAIITNSNENRATIIVNANANKDTIITNDNANRDLMIAELRRLACDIIRLLNTPEGQRTSANASCAGQPGFPYEFPEKKLSVTSGMFPSMVASTDMPALIGRTFDQVAVETSLLEGRLVPSYYLPASRGGLIEQVKDLVWNTIQSQETLGIAADETRTARSSAAAADEMLASAHFVDAYRGYVLAYQTLVPKN